MKFVNIVRNSSGSVGIGTSEPSARLYVSGSYSASETTALFKAGFPSPLGGAGVLDVQNSSGNSLLFVSGSGHVGIGTNSTAYSSAPRLSVVAGGDGRYALFERTGGGIAISLGSTSTTKLYNSWYSSSGGYYKIGYSGALTEPSDSVSLVQDTSGNVGIGTASPVTKLAVYSGAVSANYGVFSGSLAAYVSAGALYTYWNTTSNYGTIVSVADGSGTAAPMQLRVGTSLAAHIDTSGNVGIGTSSVSGKLHVYNASTATQYIGTVNHTLRLSADDSLGGVEISNAASTPIIFKMGAPGNEIGRFLPSGTWAATGSFEPGTDNTYDLGSSTKRWRNLYVNSVSGSLTGSNLTAGQIVVVGTGGVLSGSNKLYWYNANNWVGIGTNSPASQVDLYGTSGGRVQLGFDSPAFGVTIQAAATPWARYYSFQNSSNTILGSFGGYGGSNSLTYLFIGAAYDNTALRADQTTGNVTIGNASGTGRLYVTGSSTATTPTMVVREGVVTPQGGAGTFDVQNSAGTSLLFVSGSGNVGVGTSTVLDATFKVARGTAVNGTAMFLGTTNHSHFNYSSTEDTYIRGGKSTSGVIINDSASGNVTIATGGGNVGVGTTNTNGNKLAVNGQVSVTGSILPGVDNTYDLGSSSPQYRWRTLFATNISGSITPTGATAGSVFFAGASGQIAQDNANFFWDDTNNRLGIGTSSPGQRLSVVSSSPTVASFKGGTVTAVVYSDNSAAAFGDGTGGPGGAGTEFWYLHPGSLYASLYTNSAERMRVDSSGNVGINTTSMSLKLEVSGSDAKIHDVRMGRGPGAAITNTLVGGNSGGSLGSGAIYATIVGAYAGNYISTGNYNTLVGTQAGNNITTSNNNTYLGANAGYRQSGGDNTSVGRDALIGGVGATATQNTAIGTYAGYSVTTGGSNLFGGYGAGYNQSTATNNTFLGYQAAFTLTSGSNNVAVGHTAGYGETTGNQNTWVGGGAGYTQVGATSNSYFGFNTGVGATGSENTAVGRAAFANAGAAAQATAIGAGAGRYISGNSNVSLGYFALAGVSSVSTGALNVALGALALRLLTTANGNTAVGHQAGYSVTTGGNNFFGGYDAGYSNSTAVGGVVLGYQSGYYNASGSYNVSIGYMAGRGVSTASTTGIENVTIGYIAGYAMTSGNRNVVIGSAAGNSLSTGGNNVMIGYAAGYRVTTSTEVTAVGNLALAYNTGALNTAIGDESLRGFDGLSTGGGNTAIGANSGVSVTTGTNNSIVGSSAGLYLTTGTANTFMGLRAGQNTSVGGYNVAIGIDASVLNTSGSFNTSVGYQAGYSSTTANNLTSIGGNSNLYQTGAGLVAVGAGAMGGVANQSTASNNTAIGYQAAQVITTGGNNFFGGYQAGYSQSTATNNVLLGYQSGFSLTSGSNQVVIGYQSGYSLTTGDQNVIIGRTAGYTLTTAQYNTFVGMNAGRYTKSSQNTSLGFDALLGQSGGTSTGAYNVAVGYGAGRASQTGNGNLFVGYQAGLLATDGNYNTFIGYQAGDAVTTGANNIIIGSGADLASDTNSNSIVIGSGSIGIGSNTTVLGNSSTTTTYLAGNVGIGTTTFTGRLYVSGSTSATPTIVARAGVPSPSAAILAALDNDATTRFAVYGVSNGGYGGTFGVGIGTNDPFDTLHVHKNEAGYDHYPWFSNAATGGTILTLQGGAPGFNSIRSLDSLSSESWYIGGNGSANILAFKTNGGTERMRIDSSGNVGIGTATVSARLHVLGSTTTTTPTMLVKERQAADTGVAILDVQNSSGTSLFFVSGSGFVGVGTNTVATAVAGAYFHVSSSLAGNANAGISVGSQLLGTSINVYKGHTQIFQLGNGTETVRITSAGNVGIGTGANISSKLVVNGNTSVTGSVLPGADNTYDLGSASPQLRWRTLHAVNISGSLSPTGATPGSVFFAGASGQIQQDNANLFWDDTNDRLGVGTATPGFKLEVFGDFAATSKSFVIPHPLKPGWKLRHGSLEGPENGIYARGRSESEVIDLPDYWVPLADENSITVHITPVGKWQSLYVDSVENNQIKIGRGWFMRLFRIKPKYFYVVTANRKDHTFEVEYSPIG